MDRLFGGIYAPSTIGSFRRAFPFGHVRQLQSATRAFTASLVRAADRVRLVTGLGDLAAEG